MPRLSPFSSLWLLECPPQLPGVPHIPNSQLRKLPSTPTTISAQALWRISSPGWPWTNLRSSSHFPRNKPVWVGAWWGVAVQEKNMVFLGSSWPSAGNRGPLRGRQTWPQRHLPSYACVLGAPRSGLLSPSDTPEETGPQEWPLSPLPLGPADSSVWMLPHAWGKRPLHPSTSFFPSRVIPPEKTCSKPLESLSSLLLEYSPNHMFFRSLMNSCSEL